MSRHRVTSFGIALVVCSVLASSGCIRVARRVAYDAEIPKPPRPTVVACEPPPAPSVVAYPAPASIELQVSVEPSVPDAVFAAPPALAAPASAQSAAGASVTHEVLTSLGFEVVSDAHRASPGVFTIDEAIGQRGDTNAMAFRFELADPASAAAFVQHLAELGGGLVTQHDNVIGWVVTTPDDAALSRQIAALLAG